MNHIMFSSIFVAATSATVIAESITDQTTLSLGLIGGLIGAVWYLASTLQKLKDGQKVSHNRLRAIENHLGIETDNED